MTGDRSNDLPGRPVRLVNLTGHDVTVVTDDGNIVIPAEPGAVAPRVQRGTPQVGRLTTDLGDFDVSVWVDGNVEGLPEPGDGIVYVVSTQVLLAAPGRRDLVSPDTNPGRVVRDPNDPSRIVGVRGFQALP